jgi:hypothetical protein
MGQMFSEFIIDVFGMTSEGNESQPSTSGLIICLPNPVNKTALRSYVNDSNDPLKKQFLKLSYCTFD